MELKSTLGLPQGLGVWWDLLLWPQVCDITLRTCAWLGRHHVQCPWSMGPGPGGTRREEEPGEVRSCAPPCPPLSKAPWERAPRACPPALLSVADIRQSARFSCAAWRALARVRLRLQMQYSETWHVPHPGPLTALTQHLLDLTRAATPVATALSSLECSVTGAQSSVWPCTPCRLGGVPALRTCRPCSGSFHLREVVGGVCGLGLASCK